MLWNLQKTPLNTGVWRALNRRTHPCARMVALPISTGTEAPALWTLLDLTTCDSLSRCSFTSFRKVFSWVLWVILKLPNFMQEEGFGNTRLHSQVGQKGGSPGDLILAIGTWSEGSLWRLSLKPVESDANKLQVVSVRADYIIRHPVGVRSDWLIPEGKTPAQSHRPKKYYWIVYFIYFY